MKLQCKNCGYVWDYRGSGEYYATCPRCRYKVRIPRESTRKVGGGRSMSQEKSSGKLLGIAGLVNKVVEEYQYRDDMLIQILLRLQKNFGWLPMEALMEVSRQLNIPCCNLL